MSVTPSHGVGARRPPRAVTFDYWRTLCEQVGAVDEIRAAALDAVIAEHGIDLPADSDVVARACAAARIDHERAWRRNEQFVVTDASRSMWGVLGSAMPADPALARQLVAAYETAADGAVFALLPGVADALVALSSAGVAIGIICDVGLAPSTVLIANLDRQGVLERFTHWSFSDAVGVYKPDPRIFGHALQGLGVDDPRDAWHVGDLRRTDVAGARAAGMGTVRAAIVHDDHPDEGPEADAVVTDYAQLPAVLGIAPG